MTTDTFGLNRYRYRHQARDRYSDRYRHQCRPFNYLCILTPVLPDVLWHPGHLDGHLLPRLRQPPTVDLGELALIEEGQVGHALAVHHAVGLGVGVAHGEAEVVGLNSPLVFFSVLVSAIVGKKGKEKREANLLNLKARDNLEFSSSF